MVVPTVLVKRLGAKYLELKILVLKLNGSSPMPQPGDVFALTDHERLTVTQLDPDLLEVQAEWSAAGAGHRPPPHLHPRQDEHFVVHEGELGAEVDGTALTVRAGQTLDIPAGTPHRMWNAGATPVRATWQTRPALRTAEFWAEMDAARRTRPTGKGGVLTAVAVAPLLKKYRAEFQLALPAPLERGALAVLGAAARAKGYR
jgi:mannose-6-phosphate isomerase-like protein (cupin superfamily)